MVGTPLLSKLISFRFLYLTHYLKVSTALLGHPISLPLKDIVSFASHFHLFIHSMTVSSSRTNRWQCSSLPLPLCTVLLIAPPPHGCERHTSAPAIQHTSNTFELPSGHQLEGNRYVELTVPEGVQDHVLTKRRRSIGRTLVGTKKPAFHEEIKRFVLKNYNQEISDTNRDLIVSRSTVEDGTCCSSRC